MLSGGSSFNDFHENQLAIVHLFKVDSHDYHNFISLCSLNSIKAKRDHVFFCSNFSSGPPFLRLKTHGVENRRRFSTSKIGADFRLRKQTWPKKVTTMLLLLLLCIHIVAKRKKNNKKCNRNVHLPILHCLQTNQTKTMNLNQSQLLISITCYRKSTSK